MRYQNMENELLENLERLIFSLHHSITFSTFKDKFFLMRKSQEKEKTGI